MHQSAARFAAIFLCIASLVGVQVEAQVLQLAKLNTEEIADLDRDRTVVLIPAGVLEEHGPFLPSFTDGYQNEAWARDIAEAIVARPGWTVRVGRLRIVSSPSTSDGWRLGRSGGCANATGGSLPDSLPNKPMKLAARSFNKEGH